MFWQPVRVPRFEPFPALRYAPGIDWNKVVPDPRLSLAQKCIRPWAGPKASWERRVLKQFCEARGIDMHAPWGALSADERELVLYCSAGHRSVLAAGVAVTA